MPFKCLVRKILLSAQIKAPDKHHATTEKETLKNTKKPCIKLIKQLDEIENRILVRFDWLTLRLFSNHQQQKKCLRSSGTSILDKVIFR